MKSKEVEKVRELSTKLVIEGLIRERLPSLTLDFDGSVQSTKGHAEGTAVGFNKQKNRKRYIRRCKKRRWTQCHAYARLSWKSVFTLCSIMAHDLSKEVQMISTSPSIRALPKRPAVWAFHKLDTLRHRIIQRAGRLTRPQGEITLTMSGNQAVKQDLLRFLVKLREVA